jgi:5-methyltetrahydropteroyltriglutamate--homocysteine methyltransferase
MPLQAESQLKALRVDHIGSLARPANLKEVFARYDRAQATEQELHQAQDEAIREVIRKQEEHGLPVVTDGEFRRHNFQESFSEAVSGFDAPEAPGTYFDHHEPNVAPLQRAEQDFDAFGPAIVTRRPVKERLRLVRNVPLEEYRFSETVAQQPVKVTVLSPDRISQRFKWEASLSVYRGLDDFVEDVVAIERQIIAELVKAGCRYIQIDAPGYTAYVDQVSLERMRSRGEDPDKNLERSIKADNAIIDGFTGVTFGIHICRGNARTIDPNTGKLMPQWHREGHYDAIAERLFSELKHQRLLLEYDSERAGSFEPLRFVPKDKVAVLGLITTKSPDLETVETLKRRVEEASGYLDVEQMAISPQCGFGGLTSKTLTEDEQWRKLDRMMEAAVRIWGMQ